MRIPTATKPVMGKTVRSCDAQLRLFWEPLNWTATATVTVLDFLDWTAAVTATDLDFLDWTVLVPLKPLKNIVLRKS